MKRALAVIAFLGLVSGCSVDGSAVRSGTSASDPDTRACDEVVAGIDAFNVGDLDETVRHFELAVPLAEAEAAADDSEAAAALLDAVRYYAELPAEDYPEAASSSPEFARNKAITLGLCEYDGPPQAPGESPSDEGQSV